MQIFTYQNHFYIVVHIQYKHNIRPLVHIEYDIYIYRKEKAEKERERGSQEEKSLWNGVQFSRDEMWFLWFLKQCRWNIELGWNVFNANKNRSFMIMIRLDSNLLVPFVKRSEYWIQLLRATLTKPRQRTPTNVSFIVQKQQQQPKKKRFIV